jgi:hypothetical protein
VHRRGSSLSRSKEESEEPRSVWLGGSRPGGVAEEAGRVPMNHIKSLTPA